MTASDPTIEAGTSGAAVPTPRTGQAAQPDHAAELARLLKAAVEVERPARRRRRRPVIWLGTGSGAADRQREAATAADVLTGLNVQYAMPVLRGPQRGTTPTVDLLEAAAAAWEAGAGEPPRLRTFGDLLEVLRMDLAAVSPAGRAGAIRNRLLLGAADRRGAAGVVAGFAAAGTMVSIARADWASGLISKALLGLAYALLLVPALTLPPLIAQGIGRAWRLVWLQWGWRRAGGPGWVWRGLARVHPTARPKGPRAGQEQAEQALNGLLVSAFLRDLNAAYRRFLRLTDTPVAYPVLLVPPLATLPPDDVDREWAALALLLRQHLTSRRSPLVIVLVGRLPERVRDVLGDAAGEPAAGRDALAIPPDELFRTAVWRVRADPGPEVPGAVASVRLRSRTWPERSVFRGALACAVVVTLLCWLPIWGSAPAAPCAGAASWTTTVDGGPGQSIGYRLCGEPFGDPAGGPNVQRARRFQEQIFGENTSVDRRADASGRSVLTLVAITSLTTSPVDAGKVTSVMAEAEGLAGIFTAQYAINHASNGGQTSKSPFLKVVVANAGARGEHLGELMAHLKGLFTTGTIDRRGAVLGAVVTVNSTRPAQSALSALNDLPVTLISPTMTANGFGEGLPRFYQMITPNDQQALLVVDYVRRAYPGQRLVTVSPPTTPDDLYVRSLVTSVKVRAGVGGSDPRKRPVALEQVEWTADKAGEATRKPLSAYCNDRDVMFYAGRYTDFGDFIAELNYTCPVRMPPLIVDDSTSRLLSDENLAAAIPGLASVGLVTKSLPLYCGELNVSEFAAATAGQATDFARPRQQFTKDLGEALHRCRRNVASDPVDTAGLAGGWAVSSYDATQVLYWAISSSLAGTKDPVTVADGAGHALIGHLLPFGVNSPIAFDSDRVAAGGRISLYCLPKLTRAFANSSGAVNVVEVMREGRAYGADGPRPQPVPCDKLGTGR